MNISEPEDLKLERINTNRAKVTVKSLGLDLKGIITKGL